MLHLNSLLDSAWHSLALSGSLLLICLILYALGQALYNIFLHPLRSYPGPFLWRAFPLPLEYYTMRGTVSQEISKLHRQYGPQVRVRPNYISFAGAGAFKDILAHVPGRAEFPKRQFPLPPNGVPDILTANREDHSRYRRLLAHAFSEKGLRDQESHISHYVELLIDGLRKTAKAREFTQMVDWYNMVTFDVIGDLAFGESFGSLDSRELHVWIPAILGSIKSAVITACFARLGLGFFSRYFVPHEVKAARVKNYQYTQGKVDQRVKFGGDRGDFWDRIMIKSANDNATGEGMSKAEMLNNAAILVLGGSETSATTLSGATYLLLNHPLEMAKLVTEIRTTFDSSEEITLFTVSKLNYTFAVLEETMRVYPPVPAQAPRVVPKGGALVGGKYLPENTGVMPQQLAANHSEANFHRAQDFLPERWLDDAGPEFANDDKAAFQPFSMGSRNCIGRNLAYAEMRLILAKVMWHFDLELDTARAENWLDQKAWALWDKKPLWVRLKSIRE